MERAKDLLIVALVASVVFFSNLGNAKLWDRDEPRNAGCAREMMARGDWVTPIFNDELRDAKPVLLYWLIISAYQIFGVGEFAARFWSAAAGVGTVACTYFIASKLFNRRVAVLSGVILATSLMFGVAARAATPDSLLIFLSTASLAVFVRFAFSPARSPAGVDAQVDSRDFVPDESSIDQHRIGFPQSAVVAAMMYGIMGLGVLAKGPIGFLMPTAIIGMFLLIVTRKKNRTIGGEMESVNRAGVTKTSISMQILAKCRPLIDVFHPVHFFRTCRAMRLAIAITMVLLIAGPWFYLVGTATEGDFLRTFFLKEHLGRSTTSFENHSGTVFYYPLVMLVGFFPWSVFALGISFSIFKLKHDSPQLVFLLCWIGVQVGLFTLVQTKLPSYVTPCYPALAIMTGWYLNGWQSDAISIPRWISGLSFVALGIAGVLTMVGLIVAGLLLLNVGWWIGLIGVFPVVVAIVALTSFHRIGLPLARQHIVFCMAFSACLFSILFFGAVLPEVSNQQRYDELLFPIRQVDSLVADGKPVPLGSFECLEPSWIFYSGRTIYELVEQGPQRESLDYRQKKWKPKPQPDLRTFLVDEGGRVITRVKSVEKINARLGRPVSIIARSPYFLKDDQVVLVELKEPRDTGETVAQRRKDSGWE